MSSGVSRRGGRRPGASGTREAVLSAARAAFSEGGYRGTTIRGVARAAAVDPALVMHFFGSKDELFAAAMRPPVAPGPTVRRALADDPAGAGRALAELAVGAWEDEPRRQVLLGVLRAAATEPAAVAMLRGLVTAQLLDPLAEVLDGPDAALRAQLAASQIMGVAVHRYVLGLEPLASAPPDALVAWLAPSLQRVLVGDLGEGGDDG